MRKKIAVIGANGQLGTDLCKILSPIYNVNSLTHKDIEITNKKNVRVVFNRIKPDIIINTAAYTRVDDAESSPEQAFLINSIGTKILSEYCHEKNIIFVLFSTDYVFGQDQNRNTPYTESDIPAPVNTYGISKLAGEQYVQMLLKKWIIIRTTGLFGYAGSSGKGYNFVELMLRLSKQQKVVTVVSDQISSPTYTKELAEQTLTIIKSGKYGMYHVTSEGSCSWYHFAKEIFRLTKTKTKLQKVTKKTWKTPARRPHYSVLDNKKINEMNISVMSHWKQALKKYLEEKKHI